MAPSRPRPPSVRVGIAAILFAVVAGATGTELPRPADAPPAPPGAQFPADVVFDEAVNEIRDRHRLNDHSWREFIALNWPATGARGEADQKKPFGAAADHVVWATWKSLDELFPPDPETNPPTPWDSYDAELSALRPMKGVMKDAGKRRILSQAIRLGAVAQAGFRAAVLPPLVAQNRTYVRYEVRVNKTAYDFIRTNRYYLRDVIRRDVAQKKERLAFPDGSVIVKAAWMELTAQDTPDRFFHVRAELDDSPATSGDASLRPAVVGLVGFHIAHKTATRPSWIWSTFEHVDNTEPGAGGNRASFSKNDPEIIHPANNVDELPKVLKDDQPLLPNPKAVDVQRAAAVHPTTHDVNMRYHKSPAVGGTVWRNYRLVATQWIGTPDPGAPEQFNDLVQKERVFPKSDVGNTTIETYRQSSSCIGCHQSAGDFRFVFFPSIRAVPLKPPAPPKPPAGR